MPAPLHPDEPFRLEALRRLRILDSDPEPSFDQITRLASEIYRVPMATITLVDADRQWFKACIGMQDRETTRDIAFCAFTILQSEPLVVPNALEDARFAQYPNVLGPPHIRFYAGAPLLTRDGFPVGTLCILDTVPRQRETLDTAPLVALAAVTAELLELRSASTLLIDPREPDRSYAAIVADIHDVIFQTDAANRITFVNPAWSALTGYELKETLGRPIFDFIHPDDRHEAQSSWRSLADGETAFRAMRRFVHANGRTLWFSVTARADAVSGVLTGATGTVHDLTEQKRAEERLSAERERLRMTLDTAADAFVATTSEGIVTAWNEAAEGLFGYKRTDVIGRELASFLVPERFRAAHRAGIERFRKTNIAKVSGSPVELVALHASGYEIPVEITIWPMQIDGELTFQAFLKDISLRKRIAESLEQAKRSAEEASQAKSAFVATMSHEIRTPMNAVLGMAEVLAGTALTPEQTKYVDVLRRAGAGLLALINSVLDLSKIESGQLVLEHTDFDLVEVVERTLDLIRTRTKPGVAVECRMTPDVPRFVSGDPVRWQQILTNFLGNAAKFTEAGCIELRIRSLGTCRYALKCEVADTGIGIPQEKLESIFEDFAQVDASTTRKYGGTGLGLGIAKRLVEAMGGDVTVMSAVGKGSTFRFNVNFAAPSTMHKGNKKPASDMTQRSNKILIAEDNPDNRILLEIYLAGSGHTIVFAANGVEAIDLWKAQQFDLVFMDIQMPVMDGLEAAKRIRALECERGGERTPIVALTANALLSDAESTAQAGCDGHLTKPLTKQMLLDAIARYSRASESVRVIIPEGLEEICPVYLDRRKADMPKLRELLRAGNWKELRAIAHDVKGTGAAYGFPELSEMAKRIEELASACDLQHLSRQLDAMTHYLDAVKLVRE